MMRKSYKIDMNKCLTFLLQNLLIIMSLNIENILIMTIIFNKEIITVLNLKKLDNNKIKIFIKILICIHFKKLIFIHFKIKMIDFKQCLQSIK